jgi:DsbC/DsbD-like thiol-disulfide interchange protein
MTVRYLSVAGFLVLAPVMQPAPSTPQKTETPHLTVLTSAAQTRGRVSLFVDITPKARMHVYAPDKTQTYIPVALAIDADDAFKVHAPKFPPPEKYFFEPLKETQLVYSKPFRIVQDVTLVRSAAAGTVTIKGTLRYQACDDKVCYMPQKVTVGWVLKVP